MIEQQSLTNEQLSYLYWLKDRGLMDLPSMERSSQMAAAVEDAAEDIGKQLTDVKTSIQQCQRCSAGRPQAEQGQAVAQSQKLLGFGAVRPSILLLGDFATSALNEGPFVKSEQQLLDRAISAIGLDQEQVFFANIAVCRLAADYKQEAVTSCLYWLEQLVAKLSPKLIVGLGQTVGFTVLRDESFHVRKHHGQPTTVILAGLSYSFLPTFHPRTALYSEEFKRPLWEDLKKIKTLIANPQQPIIS